jgi:hypothetical protein
MDRDARDEGNFLILTMSLLYRRFTLFRSGASTEIHAEALAAVKRLFHSTVNEVDGRSG